MKAHRILLGVIVCAVGAAWFAVDASARDGGSLGMTTESVTTQGEGAMPPLDGATAWLNSEPLSAADLRGKVVLVDFWTYTCINWQRTLPHLRAWADKYKAQGLVVVGVHTPEFGFEKDIGNVRAATARLEVKFPVAVDSDGAIWRAFANQYWPALYLVDARGRIRFHHFGEGEFERSEKAIQQLLIEAGRTDVDPALVQTEGMGSQAQADWANLRSQETYVGAGRGENFGSPERLAGGRPRLYSVPERLPLNRWALSGEWTVERELARPSSARARVAFRFHARDLHLVMGPSSRGRAVSFRVLLDGRPPGSAHGVDVDAEGRGSMVEPRMYQLIRQGQPVDDRLFEIEFEDPSVQVFAFTFG